MSIHFLCCAYTLGGGQRGLWGGYLWSFQPGQWGHCLQEALLGSLPQPHQVASGVSALERGIYQFGGLGPGLTLATYPSPGPQHLEARPFPGEWPPPEPHGG